MKTNQEIATEHRDTLIAFVEDLGFMSFETLEDMYRQGQDWLTANPNSSETILMVLKLDCLEDEIRRRKNWTLEECVAYFTSPDI